MTDAVRLLHEVAELVDAQMDQIEQRRFSISWKPDGSPVTEADVYVEQAVGNLLTERLPQLEFISEENFTRFEGGGAGWTAVLDPIDGTENFCSGLAIWGLSLTLWFEGAHRASMLLLPELGRKLVTGDKIQPVRSRISGFSSSISSALTDAILEAGEARITGCAVYNLYSVVTGSFAGFRNPVGAYSWDLQAGVMLALEHGCTVEINGEPYDGRFLEPGVRHRVDVRHRHDLRSR